MKDYLNTSFKIKDLGALKYFSGIQIARSPVGLILSQCKYALDILSKTGLLGCRPADFLMQQNHKLALTEDADYEYPTRYCRLIGRLVYLTITRPKLCYVIHSLSQFMQQPKQSHYDAILRILRYIKNDPGRGLLLCTSSDL